MGCGKSAELGHDYSFFFANRPEEEEFNESLYIVDETSSIHVTSWLPVSGPKAIVIISHGLHEHGLRFFSIAHALTSRGFGVYAPDHYGHGRSKGTRGLILDYNILPNDFVKVTEWIHKKYPSIPVFILSHSMGTLVALLSINRIHNLGGVIFSGTPIFSGPGASSPFGMKCLYPLSQTSFAVTLTSIMASLDQKGAAAPIFEDALTSDPEQLRYHHIDPYIFPGAIMNKTAFETLKMIDEVKKVIPQIKVPFLCIHATEDTISLMKGSQFIIDNAATDASKKSLKTLPGKHEIFFEVPAIREQAFAIVIDYFEAQYKLVLPAMELSEVSLA